MERRSSLPCSQYHATGPDGSNPHPHIHVP